jgi:hypothetical protein
LLADTKTLASRWDWSERLFAVGFDHTLIDAPRLSEAWKRVQVWGGGPGHWYEDAESLLYCFYGLDCKIGESDARGDRARATYISDEWVAGLAAAQ